MKVRLDGKFYGIGIHIGIQHNTLTVISPIMGTPADSAGLKSMDQIINIDGVYSAELSLNEAVSKIRGKKGSPVVLGIRRLPSKEILDISIIRDEIKLQAVDKVDVFKDKIGYLRLNTFESETATKEFAKAVLKLKSQHIKALIVDIRFNGGGLLRNAINIASLLIPRGNVVHTVNRDGEKHTESVSGRTIYDKSPLIILINEGSCFCLRDISWRRKGQ